MKTIIWENTYLGIELGSTRIKGVLIDKGHKVIATGNFEWENSFENGYFTYSLCDVHKGVKSCYRSLKKDVLKKYGVKLTKVGAIGISAMMHGYLAFDKEDNLLTPFRTWRNTTTEDAAKELTELFKFNVPQRWSVAHLYQAVLNKEEHINKISFITTLSGYVHYLLTGQKEIGICDGSGMFPVDGKNYNLIMAEKFNALIKEKSLNIDILNILPKIKQAGEEGAYLTAKGAKFLDEDGDLLAGIPFCPPEGDAGTGMVATNSVSDKSGNISAGTSVFSMLVLDKPLSSVYPEVDIVTTPHGKFVAMIHSNNGCSELDGWVNIMGECLNLSGYREDKSILYERLYNNALKGDADCGGIVSYNCLAREPVTGITNNRPMLYRTPESKFNLSNLFLSLIYSALAPIKAGNELLREKENAQSLKFTAHGGLFKVKGVAQKILANAINTPVLVLETAGEGGAWGMALLAQFMCEKGNLSLDAWLEQEVFYSMEVSFEVPDKRGVESFNKYMERYVESIASVNKIK